MISSNISKWNCLSKVQTFSTAKLPYVQTGLIFSPKLLNSLFILTLPIYFHSNDCHHTNAITTYDLKLAFRHMPLSCHKVFLLHLFYNIPHHGSHPFTHLILPVHSFCFVNIVTCSLEPFSNGIVLTKFYAH